MKKKKIKSKSQTINSKDKVKIAKVNSLIKLNLKPRLKNLVLLQNLRSLPIMRKKKNFKIDSRNYQIIQLSLSLGLEIEQKLKQKYSNNNRRSNREKQVRNSKKNKQPRNRLIRQKLSKCHQKFHLYQVPVSNFSKIYQDQILLKLKRRSKT